MGFIPEGDRNQSRIMCLDDMVAKDSIARVINRFIEICDIEELGFTNTSPKKRGRNSYSPKTLAKLYLFCYEQGIRTSRKMEKACQTNIEVMWLIGGLAPDFKTIADFRRDNIAALTELFYEFTSFLESVGLFGKKLVAIDGTKIKASNSKKRNVSKKSVKRKKKHYETKVQDYLRALDEADDIEDIEDLTDKVKEAQNKADEAEYLLYEMNEAHITEISLTDQDARCMGKGKNGMQVAYNVQTAVDSKYHLVADVDITNRADDHDQLSHMALRTQETMRRCDITFLADKGYYGTADLKRCKDQSIKCIVAPQKKSGSRYQEDGYSIDAFTFDKKTDSYICPKGKELTCKSKPETKAKIYSNKQACLCCEALEKCKGASFPYRKIMRKQDAEVLEWADEHYYDNAELYKKRQQIVEHPFGTIKRTMGGDYFLLRGMDKVRCEAALLFTGYNLKRALKVLGFDELMVKLDEYAVKIGTCTANLSVFGALKVLFHALVGVFVAAFKPIVPTKRSSDSHCLA